jgi:hypothetical protein
LDINTIIRNLSQTVEWKTSIARRNAYNFSYKTHYEFSTPPLTPPKSTSKTHQEFSNKDHSSAKSSSETHCESSNLYRTPKSSKTHKKSSKKAQPSTKPSSKSDKKTKSNKIRKTRNGPKALAVLRQGIDGDVSPIMEPVDDDELEPFPEFGIQSILNRNPSEFKTLIFCRRAVVDLGATRGSTRTISKIR